MSDESVDKSLHIRIEGGVVIVNAQEVSDHITSNIGLTPQEILAKSFAEIAALVPEYPNSKTKINFHNGCRMAQKVARESDNTRIKDEIMAVLTDYLAANHPDCVGTISMDGDKRLVGLNLDGV